MLWFIIIGLIAGWLAGIIMGIPARDYVGQLIVGIVGAVLGGLVLSLLGFEAVAKRSELFTATFGAVLFLYILREYKRRP